MTDKQIIGAPARPAPNSKNSKLAPLTHASLHPAPHGFFTRQGGISVGAYASLNAALYAGDKQQAVAENRLRIMTHLGAQGLLTAKQTHSNKAVLITDKADLTDITKSADINERPQADALVTNRLGLAIGILTADCVPILLFEPHAQLVAAAHAGWKGALAGIIEATIATMEKAGATRKTICAVIGPAITAESYQVGADLHARFAEAMPDALDLFTELPQTESQDKHFLFDLRGLVWRQLEQAEIGTINQLDHCTYRQEEQFFSYRRACHRQQANYGRQLSAICLPPSRATLS
ncbi:MAG: peptidoglycan editing factor PgeF [Alphaproteobacteria bacterium]|nr:peptidoglycan editing factor PgeF [Alphaproteobacteria bacterium]